MAQVINIKEKIIKAIKSWPEFKSIRDIEIFLEFANFYQCFIQSFVKIVMLVTSMLKTIFFSKIASFSTSAEIYLKITGNSNFLILKAKLAF